MNDSPYPAFTTVGAWECIGWNDFAATHNQLASPTTSRRGMRLLRLQESLQRFLLESPLRNYWYQSGLEMAMSLTQEGNLYQLLPRSEDYQQIIPFRNP